MYLTIPAGLLSPALLIARCTTTSSHLGPTDHPEYLSTLLHSFLSPLIEIAGRESLKQTLLGAESAIRDTYPLLWGHCLGKGRNLKSLTQCMMEPGSAQCRGRPLVISKAGPKLLSWNQWPLASCSFVLNVARDR